MNESIELFGDNEIGLIAVNGVPCMDSRDIAKLTGKRHSDVCRDIRAMLAGLKADERSFASVYIGGNGERRPCYRLPKDETVTLVAGYSIELRHRIVKRWRELEEASLTIQQKPEDVIISEALILASNRLKVYESKLTLMAPKAEKYDAIVSSVGLLSFEQAAKIIANRLGIKMGRNRLFDFARDHHLLIAKSNLPYQEQIEVGRFETKLVTVNKGNGPEPYTQVFITTKGLDYICDLISRLERAV